MEKKEQSPSPSTESTIEDFKSRLQQMKEIYGRRRALQRNLLSSLQTLMPNLDKSLDNSLRIISLFTDRSFRANPIPNPNPNSNTGTKSPSESRRQFREDSEPLSRTHRKTSPIPLCFSRDCFNDEQDESTGARGMIGLNPNPNPNFDPNPNSNTSAKHPSDSHRRPRPREDSEPPPVPVGKPLPSLYALLTTVLMMNKTNQPALEAIDRNS